jgi:hypothetical protein|tara:strand:+ start:66 stop:296 length:231 start_codon:yes stop_codon:yes gene_type:complete
LIVKTDDPRYHRDVYSNALIATDQSALLKHRQKVSQTNTIMSNANEINTLKNEMNHIKKNVNKILELLSKDKDGNI